MTWKYRCSKCRGRNVFATKIDPWSKDVCRHCGYNKFYLDRRRQWRTDYCDCSSEMYHYRHRIGSPYCQHNPNYELNVRVGKYGEDKYAVLAEIAERRLDDAIERALKLGPTNDDECPF
jgi:hypothetical protein